MREQRCVGCNASSPKTDTEYTLISARHGWRLTRTRSADGTAVVEWRCPDCWKTYKQRTHGGLEAPDDAAGGVRRVGKP